MKEKGTAKDALVFVLCAVMALTTYGCVQAGMDRRYDEKVCAREEPTTEGFLACMDHAAEQRSLAREAERYNR